MPLNEKQNNLGPTEKPDHEPKAPLRFADHRKYIPKGHGSAENLLDKLKPVVLKKSKTTAPWVGKSMHEIEDYIKKMDTVKEIKREIPHIKSVQEAREEFKALKNKIAKNLQGGRRIEESQVKSIVSKLESDTGREIRDTTKTIEGWQKIDKMKKEKEFVRRKLLGKK